MTKTVVIALKSGITRLGVTSVLEGDGHQVIPVAVLSPGIVRGFQPDVIITDRLEEETAKHIRGLVPGIVLVGCGVTHLDGSFSPTGEPGDVLRALQGEHTLDATRTTSVQSPPANLTRRETDVMKALLKGYSDKEIAQELGISPRTVQTHLGRIYEKAGVNSRVEILARYRIGGQA